MTTLYLWPFFICFIPCLYYGASKWAESRKGAVTDQKIVLKQGWFSCCCCCWNEKIKSVPLDKITDLQKQQNCVQKCFDIKEIRVETASANQQEPEMSLVGLLEPDEVRKMVLAVRDKHSLNGYKPGFVSDGSGYIAPLNNSNNNNNPLLNDNNSKEVVITMQKQQETMLEVRDLLKDMKDALVSMNKKMDDRNVISNNNNNNNDNNTEGNYI